MHLSREERDFIFESVDRLLSLENWEEGESSFINIDSYGTFLRFIVFAHPERLPSLGVGSSGNLLAAWRLEKKVVYVEFLLNDKCISVMSGEFDRGPERIAWRGSVPRLQQVIENNSFSDCLNNSSSDCPG